MAVSNHLVKPSLEDTLAHYGIKGMRWGVRRDNPSGKSSGTPVSDRRGNPIRKTKRGNYRNSKGEEIAPDAARVRANQAKARAKGTDNLSTKELQELVNRLDLEKRYDKVTSSKQKSLGQKVFHELKTNKKLRAKVIGGIVSGAALTKSAYEVGKSVEKADLSKIGR